MLYTASVLTKEQFREVLNSSVSRIYLDSCADQPEKWKEYTGDAKKAGKECFFLFPQVCTSLAMDFMTKHTEELREASFDGFLIPSLEALYFLDEENLPGRRASDTGLYTMNSYAVKAMEDLGFSFVTIPLELNEREIRDVHFHKAEMVIYGRIPMMVSANCLKKTTGHCDHKPVFTVLTDRKGNEMPVRNECRYCMNTIYNALPLYLMDVEQSTFIKLGAESLRLSFTNENSRETREILSLIEKTSGKNTNINSKGFTRGHFKRGVE